MHHFTLEQGQQGIGIGYISRGNFKQVLIEYNQIRELTHLYGSRVSLVLGYLSRANGKSCIGGLQ